MKKFMAMMMAITLILTVAVASAAVPSITTNDTTIVTKPDTFKIYVADPSDVAQQQIKDLYDYVNAADGTKAPAGFFSDDVQAEIGAKLPEGVSLEDLQVNEIISLKVEDYDTTFGDVVVQMAFATVYDADAVVVVLLTLISADGTMEQVTVDASVNADGTLSITYTQDVLVKMQQAASVMLTVFNN